MRSYHKVDNRQKKNTVTTTPNSSKSKPKLINHAFSNIGQNYDKILLNLKNNKIELMNGFIYGNDNSINHKISRINLNDNDDDDNNIIEVKKNISVFYKKSNNIPDKIPNPNHKYSNSIQQKKPNQDNINDGGIIIDMDNAKSIYTEYIDDSRYTADGNNANANKDRRIMTEEKDMNMYRNRSRKERSELKRSSLKNIMNSSDILKNKKSTKGTNNNTPRKLEALYNIYARKNSYTTNTPDIYNFNIIKPSSGGGRVASAVGGESQSLPRKYNHINVDKKRKQSNLLHHNESFSPDKTLPDHENHANSNNNSSGLLKNSKIAHNRGNSSLHTDMSIIKNDYGNGDSDTYNGDFKRRSLIIESDIPSKYQKYSNVNETNSHCYGDGEGDDNEENLYMMMMLQTNKHISLSNNDINGNKNENKGMNSSMPNQEAEGGGNCIKNLGYSPNKYINKDINSEKHNQIDKEKSLISPDKSDNINNNNTSSGNKKISTLLHNSALLSVYNKVYKTKGIIANKLDKQRDTNKIENRVENKAENNRILGNKLDNKSEKTDAKINNNNSKLTNHMIITRNKIQNQDKSPYMNNSVVEEGYKSNSRTNNNHHYSMQYTKNISEEIYEGKSIKDSMKIQNSNHKISLMILENDSNHKIKSAATTTTTTKDNIMKYFKDKINENMLLINEKRLFPKKKYSIELEKLNCGQLSSIYNKDIADQNPKLYSKPAPISIPILPFNEDDNENGLKHNKGYIEKEHNKEKSESPIKSYKQSESSIPNKPKEASNHSNQKESLKNRFLLGRKSPLKPRECNRIDEGQVIDYAMIKKNNEINGHKKNARSLYDPSTLDHLVNGSRIIISKGKYNKSREDISLAKITIKDGKLMKNKEQIIINDQKYSHRDDNQYEEGAIPHQAENNNNNSDNQQQQKQQERPILLNLQYNKQEKKFYHSQSPENGISINYEDVAPLSRDSMSSCDDEALRIRLISLIKEEFSLTNQIPPTTLEYYRLVRMIGKGAFGKVYLGVHLLTGKNVAIKSIERYFMKDEQSKKKIFQEVMILSKIFHKNVIRLLEVFENRKYLFIVTEYATKGDLLTLIKQKGRLNEKETQIYFYQIVKGIKHCHNISILHRDIKLDNILLDDDNIVKICDFGVSRFVKKGEIINEQCGTPAYIAPEIIQNQGYEGFYADIWSLGVLLYAMTTGTVPFKAKNLEELHNAIIAGKFDYPDYVSFELQDLISHMMRLNPYSRINLKDILKHKWFKDIDPLQYNTNDENNILHRTIRKNSIQTLNETNIERNIGNIEGKIGIGSNNTYKTAYAGAETGQDIEINNNIGNTDLSTQQQQKQQSPISIQQQQKQQYSTLDSSTINPYSFDIVDSLIDKVELFGYPKDFIIKSLSNNSSNHATTSYFLLYKDYIKYNNQ